MRVIPTKEFLKRYVFFTDPSYPETNLVVVRTKGAQGFADTILDCAGPLTGWQDLGRSGDYQYTRIDLSRHNFEPQGSCDNGRHVMSSDEPFGLWIWGWGSPETEPTSTAGASYGYPAGENLSYVTWM